MTMTARVVCAPQCHVSRRRRTPVRATVVAGVMGGLLALLLQLGELSSMVSMGSLVAYSMVCLGVLCRRWVGGRVWG